MGKNHSSSQVIQVKTFKSSHSSQVISHDFTWLSWAVTWQGLGGFCDLTLTWLILIPDLIWLKTKAFSHIPAYFFYFAEQAHVYLMNCSESAEVCQRQNIGGYPTLAAYRSISWLHHAKCLSVKTSKILKYARHDYHGLMMVSRASEIYLCWCWILNHKTAKQTRQVFVWIVNVNFDEN